MSDYLKGVTDAYGLPPTLPVGIATLASDIVDGYLKRPEGVVYVADNNGNPVAMAGMLPTQVYKVTGALSAGTNVVATLTPANIRADMIGEVMVLDFANANLVEACVIVSVTGNSQVTFGTVAFAHSANASADIGRVITEDRACPAKRSIIRIAKWPIVNVVSLLGRYAYGRRSDQIAGLYQDMNLLASVTTFGGPPAWSPITVSQASYSDQTGEVWIPAGILMAYYSNVRIKYVAGYPEPPHPIVRATAQIAAAILATDGMPANIKVMAAGDTRLERFSASTIDADVKSLLDPFRARTMY
jgi:hypothetical protein